jgi:hypothetical protein
MLGQTKSVMCGLDGEGVPHAVDALQPDDVAGVRAAFCRLEENASLTGCASPAAPGPVAAATPVDLGLGALSAVSLTYAVADATVELYEGRSTQKLRAYGPEGTTAEAFLGHFRRMKDGHPELTQDAVVGPHPRSMSGVSIGSLARESPLAAFGIQAGEIIRAVGDLPVATVAEFEQASAMIHLLPMKFSVCDTRFTEEIVPTLCREVLVGP